MFEDVRLFVSIAGIAGVFVGFAALIAVTRRSEINASQLGQIQAVVTNGLLVVVAALVPVGVNAYGVTGHGLWLSSALVYLALNWIVIVSALRMPENRELAGAQARATPITAGFFWLLEIGVQLPLVLVIVGLNREFDVAFYLTALLLHLFEAAFILTQLVYTQVDRQQD